MMAIRTLGSLLETCIFLGTAPFGQQIHCQRNTAPNLNLPGHVANFLFFPRLQAKLFFPHMIILSIHPFNGIYLLKTRLNLCSQYIMLGTSV